MLNLEVTHQRVVFVMYHVTVTSATSPTASLPAQKSSTVGFGPSSYKTAKRVKDYRTAGIINYNEASRVEHDVRPVVAS